jgi:hypothetical protein
MADLPPTTNPVIIDLTKARKLRRLALALADAAAVTTDPERQRLLEQAALRTWQAARRHSWPGPAARA